MGGRNFVCRTGTPFDRFRDDSRNYFTGSEVIGRVLFKYFIERKRGRLGVFSPAANLFPGKRTGKFRLGKDNMIVDDQGESSVSVEDYAVAMIDEVEYPTHHYERFTIGN